MTIYPVDHTDEARAALSAIVSDPAHGLAALDDPRVVSSLLSDYLPDAPRESGLLMAAVTVGVPGILRDHVGQGMDPDTAVHLTAASLTTRTAFTADSCRWVTVEIARALGYEVSGNVPVLPPAPSGPGIWTRTAQPVPAAQRPAAVAPVAPKGRRRPGRLFLAAGIVVIVAVAAGAFALAHHRQPSQPPLPAPHLASFVPASQQVLKVRRFALASGHAPVIAVTTTAGQPSSADEPYAAENLLLLGWDQYARRWTVVYSAAQDKVNITYQADAYTDSFQASYLPPAAPLIPKSLGVEGIGLTAIKDQPAGGADLLITANVLYADGTGQVMGIVHFDGHLAKVVWAFGAKGAGSRVIGPPGHQQLAVTALWYTESDPQCCASRSYQFVLARSAEPQIGETFSVVSDNRPWLGAIVSEQPSSSPNSEATVISAVPGSPAAGVLRPGDVLAGVTGSSVQSHGLGPAIFDQLASYRPGQVISLNIFRNGTPLTVQIRAGSLADSKAIAAGSSLPPPNGSTGQYML